MTKKSFKNRHRIALKSIILVVTILFTMLFLVSSYDLSGNRIEYNTGETDVTGVSDTSWQGQVFTLGTTGIDGNYVLNGIQLKVSSAGGGDANISIWNVSAGLPNTMLGSAYFNTANFTGSLTYTNFTMPQVYLNQSQSYAIIIFSPNAGGVQISRYDSGTGNYAGGTEVHSIDSGATWAKRTSADFPFEVWAGTGILVQTTLVSPANGSRVYYQNVNLNASYVATTLINATYYIWNSSNSLINTSYFSITGTSNTTSYFINLSQQATYHWNVYGCGNNATSTDCSFTANNYTFYTIPIIVNSQAYNSSVYETENQNFQINITTVSSTLSASADLYYNGTFYSGNATCDGYNCIASKSIDIVLVGTGENEIKQFFWSVNIYDGTNTYNINTTLTNQTINRIHLQECDGTYNYNVLNFTAYREENRTRINPFSISGIFNYWIGSGSIYRTLSINNISTSAEKLCMLPNNRTMSTTANIEYSFGDSNASYLPRNYYLENATINNVSSDINLYLLDTTSATTFIESVMDNSRNPIANAIIFIQRCYPDIPICSTIQMAKTDVNGKTVGFYKTETVDYQHIIVLNGQVIYSDSPHKIFGTSIPYTNEFFVGNNAPLPWSYFDELPSLYSLLFFNSTTNIATYTYIDTSGLFAQGRLLVEQENITGRSPVVCNITSIQASAIISCNVSAYTGSFFAQGFITRSEEKLTDSISFIVSTALATFGEEGLFLAWFIILVSAMAFIWHPIAGIWAMTATVIFVNIIGLASFGLVWIFSLIAISIIMTVIFK